MSINTTSTSDRIATDSVTSASTEKEGSQRYEGVSRLISAVPDPAVIAKLANEFFAALPGATVPAKSAVSAAPNQPNANPEALPVSVPDYPRETFSIAAPPNSDRFTGAPHSPSPPVGVPAGTLDESDFHAIAASLAGTLPLNSQSSSAALPTPPVSSSSFDGEKDGPWAGAPSIPPATEMYSFPGVPALSPVPQTGPPSGSDLAVVSASPSVPTARNAGRTAPWSDGPHFAGLSDVYLFPRVPGASVPGVPQVNKSQPSTPASQPTAAIPIAVANIAKSTPAISNSPLPSPAVKKSPPDTSGNLSSAAQDAAYASATKFPTISELFSFPGIPGMQSLPGTPVAPTSIPAKVPTYGDLRDQPSAPTVLLAMPSAISSVEPAIPALASPSLSAATPEARTTAPHASSLPAGIESFEFRPDLESAKLEHSNRPLDPHLIRQDFPILREQVNGHPLIWLDNAATTQKPNAVIDRLSYFYRHENSNIHRAAHTLAARATDAYESAREKTRRFMNASSTREIIFVRGTTEGINLVAKSWGHRYVQKDDEIVITWLEHHANIVPWQQLCSEKGARLRVAPVNDRGEVILEEYEKLLSPRTRIVSFSQVSNALGTITPAREMVEMAHRHGARVLVDGAQSVSHMRTDVQALDCDFYVFSGHKVFGPTGIGVVYGKLDVLENTPPWQGGGNMIVDVTFEKTVYQSAPGRFEAGTGNIADAVGLGAALDYVEQVGIESIAAYEHELLNYATAGLLTVPGLKLIGTAREKAGVLSFVLNEFRTEDVGIALNQEGIAVRAGHHCAQPILRRFGVESTVRPSLALYNTCEDIDALVAALLRIQAERGHR
jgi:cysteine desulfurase / selenocysteine lyase